MNAYPITHKALFAKLRDDTVICKSEQYAHWTLPALMADLYNNKGNYGKQVILERDYQEVGALLVNNLAAKLAQLLFPSSRPFFKANMSPELKQAAARIGKPDSEVQAGLARMEMDAAQLVFRNASYNQLVMAAKHLIVTGNVLTYRDTVAHKTSTYGLQSFVVRRDGKGNVLDCILRECTFVEALDEAVQAVLRAKDRARYSRPEQPVEIYTRIKRRVVGGDAFYDVTQEVDTTSVGTLGSYPEHLCPWQVIPWNLIVGEHYARGMVEDYAGGFAKLSDLSEAEALYSIELMRVIHLVGAGSGTDIDDMANAETGEYIVGDANAVNAHESGDGSKLQQVAGRISETVQRLSRAFMYTGNTRDAERVTAAELAQNAREAENVLGGTYSALAESWQVPLAHVLLFESKPDVLAGLISGDMKLDITAGIPALGRASDVQNLLNATQEASAIVPALSQLDRRVDPQKVVDLIMAGQSVDTSRIYKDKDTLAKEARAEQKMAQGQAEMLAAQDSAVLAEQTQLLQGQA